MRQFTIYDAHGYRVVDVSGDDRTGYTVTDRAGKIMVRAAKEGELMAALADFAPHGVWEKH